MDSYAQVVYIGNAPWLETRVSHERPQNLCVVKLSCLDVTYPAAHTLFVKAFGERGFAIFSNRIKQAN
jgi:hypothetical protein